MTTTFCVLGLGTMGGRVATKLAVGADVRGYDPASAACVRAADAGVDVRETPEEAIAGADLIVLSVPMPDDVLTAARGPLLQARDGAVIADLSTIDPDTARAAAETLAAAGIGYVDAPVVGRPDRCGHWTLPAGGKEQHVATVRSALEGVVAARVARIGEVGAGSVVKLLNNLMFGAINAVTVEVLNTCQLAGVDPDLFARTVADSGAATVSNLFRELTPRLLEDDYDPTFALALLHKDNRLAAELLRHVGAPAFLTSAVDQVNTLAVHQGLRALDSGAVQELYRRLSRVAESR